MKKLDKIQLNSLKRDLSDAIQEYYLESGKYGNIEKFHQVGGEKGSKSDYAYLLQTDKIDGVEYFVILLGWNNGLFEIVDVYDQWGRAEKEFDSYVDPMSPSMSTVENKIAEALRPYAPKKNPIFDIEILATVPHYNYPSRDIHYVKVNLVSGKVKWWLVEMSSKGVNPFVSGTRNQIDIRWDALTFAHLINSYSWPSNVKVMVDEANALRSIITVYGSYQVTPERLVKSLDNKVGGLRVRFSKDGHHINITHDLLTKRVRARILRDEDGSTIVIGK